MNDNLLDMYQADLSLRNLAETTFYTNTNDTKNYLTWLDSRGLDPLTVDPRLYLKVLRDRHLTPASIKIIFSHLSTFYDYLERENLIQKNPIPRIQKTYLSEYKKTEKIRKAISIDQAAELVHLTTRTRDKAILLLLLKTGIKRHELVTLDVNSLDFDNQSLTLKETHKRSNRAVFLDEETISTLRRWLNIRETWPKADGEKALFLNNWGLRLADSSIDDIAKKAVERVNRAGRVGHINFSPHIARYCMTTWLLDAEMPVRYIKWLRGDAIREAYEIYDTVRPEDVKKSYLENVPQFGI